jgi:hypothetical protein
MPKVHKIVSVGVTVAVLALGSIGVVSADEHSPVGPPGEKLGPQMKVYVQENGPLGAEVAAMASEEPGARAEFVADEIAGGEMAEHVHELLDLAPPGLEAE